MKILFQKTLATQRTMVIFNFILSSINVIYILKK